MRLADFLSFCHLVQSIGWDIVVQPSPGSLQSQGIDTRPVWFLVSRYNSSRQRRRLKRSSNWFGCCCRCCCAADTYYWLWRDSQKEVGVLYYVTLSHKMGLKSLGPIRAAGREARDSRSPCPPAWLCCFNWPKPAILICFGYKPDANTKSLSILCTC